MDGHEAAAVADVALEGGLLVDDGAVLHRVRGPERVQAHGRVPDDDLVLGQVGGAGERRVVERLGRIVVVPEVDVEAELLAQLLDQHVAVLDRRVAEAVRALRDDEDLELRVRVAGRHRRAHVRVARGARRTRADVVPRSDGTAGSGSPRSTRMSSCASVISRSRALALDTPRGLGGEGLQLADRGHRVVDVAGGLGRGQLRAQRGDVRRRGSCPPCPSASAARRRRRTTS